MRDQGARALAREHVEALARKIAEGCGHWVEQTQPKACIACVAAALQEPRGQQALTDEERARLGEIIEYVLLQPVEPERHSTTSLAWLLALVMRLAGSPAPAAAPPLRCPACDTLATNCPYPDHPRVAADRLLAARAGVSDEALAEIVYDHHERIRAEEEDGPERAVWVPWKAQTSRREKRIYLALAKAVRATLAGGQG